MRRKYWVDQKSRLAAEKYIATVTKEIILSAGTFNTPALLQLSGIGDPEHLGSLGIQTRVVRPDVGKNLQDHPLFLMHYSVNTTDTFDPVFRGESIAVNSHDIWFKNHSGKFDPTF
jgi:choline dehydrogenase-like flavoprotein